MTETFSILNHSLKSNKVKIEAFSDLNLFGIDLFRKSVFVGLGD